MRPSFLVTRFINDPHPAAGDFLKQLVIAEFALRRGFFRDAGPASLCRAFGPGCIDNSSLIGRLVVGVFGGNVDRLICVFLLRHPGRR